MKPLDPVADEIDAARRQAHVYQSRGDRESASKIIDAVIAKYPDHPDAQEALADNLISAGELNKAKDVLAEIVRTNPGRIETERKHARLVLKLEERNLSASLLMGEGDFASLMNPAGVKRSAGTAAILSLLAPGFGQIYNGQLVRGIVLLLVAVVLWTLMFTIGYVGAGQSGQMTAIGWALAVLLVALYMGCLLDAAISAPKHTVAAPSRPVPPVDKPFE
jgi:TM2 domain-containing membrane protein YozV